MTDGCALTVISGWCGTHFPDSPAIAADGSHDAPPATSTTPSGAGRLGESTLRQRTADVETAGLFHSRGSKSTMTTRPWFLEIGYADRVTARAGTAGWRPAPGLRPCETQCWRCLLAYHGLLGQMDASPTRLRIARKLEQLADSALEGSWQKELRDKWRAAQSSCAS